MKLLFFTLMLATYLQGEATITATFNDKLIKLSQNDLKNLYLGKINKINGIYLIPIDSQNKKEFSTFYKKIINKTPKQLHAYWVKQIYKGNRQPPLKFSKNKFPKNIEKNRHFIRYDLNPINGEIHLIIK